MSNFIFMLLAIFILGFYCGLFVGTFQEYYRLKKKHNQLLEEHRQLTEHDPYCNCPECR